MVDNKKKDGSLNIFSMKESKRTVAFTPTGAQHAFRTDPTLSWGVSCCRSAQRGRVLRDAQNTNDLRVSERYMDWLLDKNSWFNKDTAVANVFAHVLSVHAPVSKISPKPLHGFNETFNVFSSRWLLQPAELSKHKWLQFNWFCWYCSELRFGVVVTEGNLQHLQALTKTMKLSLLDVVLSCLNLYKEIINHVSLNYFYISNLHTLRNKNKRNCCCRSLLLF